MCQGNSTNSIFVDTFIMINFLISFDIELLDAAIVTTCKEPSIITCLGDPQDIAFMDTFIMIYLLMSLNVNLLDTHIITCCK